MCKQKCIIILSEKSSGSSAFQNFLTKFPNVHHIKKTKHKQNETLYWTKAASILSMPQLKMVDSEVPISCSKAKKDLISILKNNLIKYTPPLNDRDLIMDGWRLLCNNYSPIFLEKSPHHLCQWSAIELIIDCIRNLNEIDFLLIGLVRNPMDTIYSQYKRWNSSPQKVQKQWLIAYQNLIRLKKIVKDKLLIIRYEDMVTSINYIEPVLSFCRVSLNRIERAYFHQKSIKKWKNDLLFGFSLSQEVIELAMLYGYKRDELTNNTYLLWPIVEKVIRAAYISSRPIKKFAIKLIRDTY